MEEVVYLGKFIKMQRQKANLNVSQLAKKCNFSRSYISQIESGLIRPSNKFDETISYIFQNLGLSYDLYKSNDELYAEKINNLLHAIFYLDKEMRDRRYFELYNFEDSLHSYKIYPQFYLCKFVYLLTTHNTITEEIDISKNVLLKSVDLLDTNNKAILYTYLGVYYRMHIDLNLSNQYLMQATSLPNEAVILGIAYFQLAITQSLQNKLLLAYSNILTANTIFFKNKNFKRVLHAQVEEAIILGRAKEYEKAESIYQDILKTYKVSKEQKAVIYINRAQIQFNQGNYKKALSILSKIKIQSDNLHYIRLLSFHKLALIDKFNTYYIGVIDTIKDLAFKEQIQITHLCANGKEDEFYVNLMLSNLERVHGKYDVDFEIFILDALIAYFEKNEKYKVANKYIKQKVNMLL